MRSFASLCISILALALLACDRAGAPVVVDLKKFTSDSEVPRISVEDAKQEVDAGNAVIVDSRAGSAFGQEHVAGALNIPFGSNNDAFSTLPKGKKIIVYCS